MMTPSKWDGAFYKLFREAVVRFHSNGRYSDLFFTDQEALFLASIGCRAKELYGLVSLYAQTGYPSPSTILLMAAVRRDFFNVVHEGQFQQIPVVTTHDLPSFGDEIKGIPYLPRLIKKAQAKLLGSLGEDVIYGCEQDQAFLQEHGGIHLADFLMIVWRANDNDMLVANWVKDQSFKVSQLSEEA